jgi:hypothetical protein
MKDDFGGPPVVLHPTIISPIIHGRISHSQAQVKGETGGDTYQGKESVHPQAQVERRQRKIQTKRGRLPSTSSGRGGGRGGCRPDRRMHSSTSLGREEVRE